MQHILHINDVALTLWRDNTPLVSSPAYIVIDGKKASIGESARAQAKLQPTKTEHDYWQRFGTDPLLRPNRLASTQADLAYMQLESVRAAAGSMDGVQVAVPGDWQSEQLGLLLGMLQRQKWPVNVIADAALLFANQQAPGRQLYFLEQHRHRLVLTELRQGAELEVGQSISNAELGFQRWQRAWSQAVADEFINATRLDPLHNAAIEQQVFDSLPQWITQLSAEPVIEAQLDHQGKAVRAPLSQAQMDTAVKPLLGTLSRFIAEYLPRQSTVVLDRSLSEQATIIAALRELPGVELLAAKAPLSIDVPTGQSQVVRVRSKPWLSAADDAHQYQLNDQDQQSPTHVLFDGIARPLQETLSVGSGDSDQLSVPARLGVGATQLLLKRHNGQIFARSSAPVQVNGVSLSDNQPLIAGDRLRFGERDAVELQLIVVEDQG